MSAKYTCPFHHVKLEGWCPQCLAFLANAPDPNTMTGVERVAEMNRWHDDDILTVPFARLVERFYALVGHHFFDASLVTMWGTLVATAGQPRGDELV